MTLALKQPFWYQFTTSFINKFILAWSFQIQIQFIQCELDDLWEINGEQPVAT